MRGSRFEDQTFWQRPPGSDDPERRCELGWIEPCSVETTDIDHEAALAAEGAPRHELVALRARDVRGLIHRARRLGPRERGGGRVRVAQLREPGVGDEGSPAPVAPEDAVATTASERGRATGARPVHGIVERFEHPGVPARRARTNVRSVHVHARSARERA